MKKLVLAFLTAISLLFVVTGCMTTKRVVLGLGLELTTLERASDGTVTATVTITNPNVVSYNIARATHRIFIADKFIGILNITSPTGLPVQQAATQSGTVTLERGTSLPAGEARYRLESTLVMRLYGDNTQQQKTSGSGTVTITTK